MTTAPRPKQPVTEKFQFGPWTLTTTKSHILVSEGPEREGFEKQLKLPQVPEMVFADNLLRLEHERGFGIEFTALEALKLVDALNDPWQVAAAQVWQQARADCEHIKKVVKPFDWTYTTSYQGTIFSQNDAEMTVAPTDDRIDMEKLKQREKIMFYDDIMLFEDELSDNGISMMNVKIRVMPTSFFILLRLYMRVDNVIVRMNDTRLYHEGDKNFVLREYSSRDERLEKLKVPLSVLTNPTEVMEHLPIRHQLFEKLSFPG